MLVIVAIVAVAPAGAKSAKPPAKCSKGTIALTVNGKRTCVKAASVKPTTSKFTSEMGWVRMALGMDGWASPRVKLYKGKPFAGFFSTKEQKNVTGLFGALDSSMLSTAHSGFTTKSSRASKSARGGWKMGNSTWNQSTNADTGQTSGSGHAEGETTTDDGGTVKVEVDVDVNGDASSGADPDVDMGVKATYESAPGTTSSRGFKMGVKLKDGSPSCPDYSGHVDFNEPIRVTTSSSDADHLGKLVIDSVKSARTINGSVKSSFTMQDDATLPQIPFTATMTISATLQVKVIGIPVANQKVTTKVTASGTIDPKTGNVNTGTQMDVQSTASGVGNAASYKATMTAAALKTMRDSLGRMHGKLKALEKNALNGQCTRIDFSPSSDTVELGKDETMQLQADLHSDTEQDRSVSGPVKVTFTPQKGKVSPASDTSNPSNVTVTGGEDIAEPAVLDVRMVSRAGISKAPWAAKMKNPFPKTYSGTMSYESVVTSTTTKTNSGASPVTWTLSKWNRRYDGSYIATYSLTSFAPTHLQQKAQSSGGCIEDSGEEIGRVSFMALGSSSFLQVIIGTDGAWKAWSRIYAPVNEYTMTGTRSGTCSGATTFYSVPGFDYADGARNNGSADYQFRSMPVRGAYSGTNVSGLWWQDNYAAGIYTTSGHATWHYDPSSD